MSPAEGLAVCGSMERSCASQGFEILKSSAAGPPHQACTSNSYCFPNNCSHDTVTRKTLVILAGKGGVRVKHLQSCQPRVVGEGSSPSQQT